AAHRLHREVEAALLLARTFLAERGDRAVDERGLFCPERGVSKAEAIHYAGAIVLDQHVGREHERARARLVRRILEVERDRALVAVERGEVFAVATGDRGPLAHA